MAERAFSPAGAVRSATTSVKRLILRRAPKPVVYQLRRAQKRVKVARIQRASAGGYPAVAPGNTLATPVPALHYPFTVGCILDEFSFAAWGPEFNLESVQPGELVPPIDFLLVEAAWQGNGGTWQSQLVGQSAPSPQLRELIEQCQRRSIPTVFWNKEDPSHFEDFKNTAALFDVIATTDSNMVAEYQQLFPTATVIVLPFAAQPVLHNPARNEITESGDIAFAGTYFRHKFEDRRQQMDLLLGGAHRVSQQSNTSFTIFSRHAGAESKYQFPSKWGKHVVGSLPYPEMLGAYRAFKVFLNVNSVTSSPSMCARRIFELAGSGTPVVSTESAALHNFFSDDEVPVVRSGEEAELVLRSLVGSELLRRRTAHLALRRVWEKHTYRHRAEAIVDALGLSHSMLEIPMVSVICSTNRDATLEHLLDQVAAQTYKNVELLVLGHGVQIADDFRERAFRAGVKKVTVLNGEASQSLGACLNALIGAASGEVIAKFDDDDYYLPNYLRDQVNTLINMNADLVGKGSIYFYLPGSDVIARRWKHQEHIWRNFVAGATFVGWREIFLETPFANRTRGEDSDFLLRLERKGRKVYSSDSFNYLCIRGNAEHTWAISEAEILANSEVETIGMNLKHLEV